MVGLKIGTWDRSSYGDGVLLVNVDGLVYRVLDAYVPALALGNIALQPLSDILQSEAYVESLARDRKEREDHSTSASIKLHAAVDTFTTRA